MKLSNKTPNNPEESTINTEHKLPRSGFSATKPAKRFRLKWSNRAIHRDLGYFYLGLIISFALSGIMLNHRLSLHLDQYTLSSNPFIIDLQENHYLSSDTTAAKAGSFQDEPGRKRNKHNGRRGGSNPEGTNSSDNMQNNKNVISEAFLQEISKRFGLKDSLRRQFIQKGKIRLAYVNHTIEIDLRTGKGTITEFRKTPFLGHMVQLHRTNLNAWVCFSDSFAVSLILIAITGVLLPKGKNSFRKRGWIFSVAGIIFPLIVLFFLS